MADVIIRSALTSCNAATRARLIATAPQYITDTNLTNLMQNIDINAPKKFNYGLFAAFTGVPGILDQLNVWMLS